MKQTILRPRYPNLNFPINGTLQNRIYKFQQWNHVYRTICLSEMIIMMCALLQSFKIFRSRSTDPHIKKRGWLPRFPSPLIEPGWNPRSLFPLPLPRPAPQDREQGWHSSESAPGAGQNTDLREIEDCTYTWSLCKGPMHFLRVRCITSTNTAEVRCPSYRRVKVDAIKVIPVEVVYYMCVRLIKVSLLCFSKIYGKWSRDAPIFPLTLPSFSGRNISLRN